MTVSSFQELCTRSLRARHLVRHCRRLLALETLPATAHRESGLSLERQGVSRNRVYLAMVMGGSLRGISVAVIRNS